MRWSSGNWTKDGSAVVDNAKGRRSEEAMDSAMSSLDVSSAWTRTAGALPAAGHGVLFMAPATIWRPAEREGERGELGRESRKKRGGGGDGERWHDPVAGAAR